MNEKQLLTSLNDHQKPYCNLSLGAKTGEYMLCVFHLKPGKALNILQAACEVAAESSTGTNFKVNTETAFSRIDFSQKQNNHRLLLHAQNCFKRFVP